MNSLSRTRSASPALSSPVGHRVAPSYEAEAEDLNSESLLRMLFDGVPVP